MGHPYQPNDGHPQYPYMPGGPPRPMHHMQQPIPGAKPLTRPVSQQSVIPGPTHQTPKVNFNLVWNVIFFFTELKLIFGIILEDGAGFE